MGTLLLIDAYSQIYRAFYAIRNLTDQAGRPVNALFGMARLVLQLEETFPCDYGAMVYDLGKCTRRCALLPDYKAQRPPMPPELRLQLEDIREWGQAFGWNLVEREGVEADGPLLAVGEDAARDEEAVRVGAVLLPRGGEGGVELLGELGLPGVLLLLGRRAPFPVGGGGRRGLGNGLLREGGGGEQGQGGGKKCFHARGV